MPFVNFNIPMNRRLLIGLTASTSIAAAYLFYQWKWNNSSKDNKRKEQVDKLLGSEEKKELTAYELKEKGNRYFRENKFEEAKNCYTESLGRLEEDDQAFRAILYCNIAAAWEGLGNPLACVESASEALALNPHYPKAYIRRASAYEKLNEKEKFIKDKAASIILNGTSIPSDREKIDTVITAVAEERTEEYLKERPIPRIAKYHVQRFIADIFVDDIFLENDQNVIKEEYANDDNLEHYLEAIKSFELGDMANCIASATHILDRSDIESLNSLQQRALLLRATAEFAILDTDKTDSDVKLLLRQPNLTKQMQIAAHLRVVASHLHNMEIDTGLTALQEVMRLDPDRAHTHFFLGQVYLLLSNMKMADLCTKHALNKDPEEKKYEAQLLVIRAHEAKMSENESELKAVLDEFKSLCDASNNKVEMKVEYAQLLHELGYHEESETLMLEEVDAADNVYRPHVLTQLAVQYLSRGNLTAAEDAVSDALAIDGNVENALQIKATILYRRGDIIGSIAYLQDLMKVARGRHAVVLSMASVIAMEIQEALSRELELPASDCSKFTSYLETLNNM